MRRETCSTATSASLKLVSLHNNCGTQKMWEGVNACAYCNGRSYLFRKELLRGGEPGGDFNTTLIPERNECPPISRCHAGARIALHLLQQALHVSKLKMRGDLSHVVHGLPYAPRADAIQDENKWNVTGIKYKPILWKTRYTSNMGATRINTRGNTLENKVYTPSACSKLR